MKSSTPFPRRVRFNMGYHAGAAYGAKKKDGQEVLFVRGTPFSGSVEDWATKHFDRVYSAAFLLGNRDFKEGKYEEDSDLAWSEFVARNKEALANKKRVQDNYPRKF